VIEQPAGTVTLVFTDVEGSTRLLLELGQESFQAALSRHQELLRRAFARHRGYEVDFEGDGFFYAFSSATEALAAVQEALAALEGGPVRVRVGIHTGEPVLVRPKYVGIDVHKAARIAAVGHGGQVLLSQSTRDLVQVDTRDLGEYRLKDLPAAERLFQVGAEEFPPLRARHRSNLPLPAAALIGRTSELGELVSLLRREDVRLVTITGAGGSGKTRLAVEAAGEMASKDGADVWWIPLAALRDPRLVVEAIARAVGARGALADHIGDRPMLLLLDNFEHLLDAAVEIAALLSVCPRLRVLVTSRELLRIGGEWAYELDPLHEREAIVLFVERARARGEFSDNDAIVLEVCRRLDCLPLAIELAAARVQALPLATILQRLEQRLPVLAEGPRDAPERQRTLRATIEWSHDLLSDEDKQLFARLAVFIGGCTLQTAELTCEAELESLSSLVERNLLRRSDERFWMLETIREFAAERLQARGETDLLGLQHARTTLDLIRAGRPSRLGFPSADWLELFDSERANVRAAMDWATAQDETDLLTDLVYAAFPYWGMRAEFTEGRLRVDDVLNRSRSWTPIRAELLAFAAQAAYEQGDYRQALAAAEEQLAGCRADNDFLGTVAALSGAGSFAAMLGDRANAIGFAEEAVRLARTNGDEQAIAVALSGLVSTLVELRDYRRVIEEANGAIDLLATLDNALPLAQALGNKGHAHLALGQLEQAGELYRRCLKLAQEQDAVVLVWYGLVSLAGAAAKSGDFVRAATLTGAADAIHNSIGTTLDPAETALFAGTAETARAALDETAYEDALEIGTAMSRESAVRYALSDVS
jgi:predicted ATPase/class 3 adenylate cyclase